MYKYTMQLRLDTPLSYEIFRFFAFWRGILSAMDGIIILLNKLKFNFVYEGLDNSFFQYWPLYMYCMLPLLYLDDAFIDLNPITCS